MTRGWPLAAYLPTPFSPVHNARKFSAVLGTTSERSSISMRPFGEPPMVMSKNTTGLSLMVDSTVMFVSATAHVCILMYIEYTYVPYGTSCMDPVSFDGSFDSGILSELIFSIVSVTEMEGGLRGVMLVRRRSRPASACFVL